MPPPKRPKKGLTWMNELLNDDGTVSEAGHRENLLDDRTTAHNAWYSYEQLTEIKNKENKLSVRCSSPSTETKLPEQQHELKSGSDSSECDMSDSELGTTMVRSDSMSSTDSLKENKEPIRISQAPKNGNLNGEKTHVKVRSAAGDHVVGSLSKPITPYSSKQPMLPLLFSDYNCQTVLDCCDRKQRKPILESLLSDVKNDQGCHPPLSSSHSKSHLEECDADRVRPGDHLAKQKMYGRDLLYNRNAASIVKPHATSSRPIDLSTVSQQSQDGNSVNHISNLYSALRHSPGKDHALEAANSSGSQKSDKLSKEQRSDNIDDLPSLLPMQHSSVALSGENMFVSAGQGVNDRLISAYIRTQCRTSEKAASNSRCLSSSKTMHANSDRGPSLCNQYSSQAGIHKQAVAAPSTSAFRQDSNCSYGALPSSPSDRCTAPANAPTSKNSLGETAGDIIKSRLKLLPPKSASLTQYINCIVTDVLFSAEKAENLKKPADSSNCVATSTRRRGYLSRLMESPPSEFNDNYATYQGQLDASPGHDVLPPGEQAESQGHCRVLPPREGADNRTFAGSTVSCSEECSRMSKGHPYSSDDFPAEKPELRVCTQDAGFEGDQFMRSPSPAKDSMRHSGHGLSPRHDDDSPDTHSVNMEIPSSTSEIAKTPHSAGNGDDVKTAHLCQVCNDAASGFHYGVWSCEGCKAFFKRSLQGPVNYICPATNSCTIDKHRRKSCQACRLRKCIEMGMSRGNCREKKGPHQRQMKRKSQDLDLKSDTSTKVSPSYPGQSSKREPQVCSVRPLVDPDCRSLTQSSGAPSSATDQQMIHPLVEHLLKIEPPVRFVNTENVLQQMPENILTALLHLADTQLMDIVTWARGIPGYMELPLIERMQLLESAWMEILILGLLWRSVSHQDALVFAPDVVITRQSLPVVQFLWLFDEAVTLVNVLRQHRLNQEEMVLLRACILLNAGVQNLDTEKYFQELQDKVHTALQYTTVERGKHPVSRMTRLLLFLPRLRQISLEVVALLSRLQQQEKLPQTVGLISEILSKHNTNPH